ncbi:MAG: acetyl-CoA carboxylase biotin carboxylase subunit [Oscillospiraceae bacterium]|jgi:acetyl-CoA carboxylase biotin carboxylase subunit|nr:acetyl-CoA carboxylase biotin carboxylase subunit [Oscillospiraceae bacterium]
MFKRILIANRGEIAVRIIRTCRDLGIISVAVFSEADRDSMHAQIADEAVCIGPAALGESYLNAGRILAAALAVGADAVHPGYGFLSENAHFAECAAACGLTFIGPPPEAIRLLGDKARAIQTARAAGVPVVPGSEGVVPDAERAAAVAREIGYPLLIKAVSGGGGRGIRLVEEPSALAAAYTAACAEAQAGFGDGSVYIERFLRRPRHIEFQVLGDQYERIVHLFERECSIQRRHQKLIEESPSPLLTADLRAEMGAAAVRLAQAAGYSGAGTVEFLVDENRAFYFIEMNPRIQVEHPVTECVTGLDLVAEQIRIAAGQPLGLSQADLRQRGHAIECRVNAEDPARGFLPVPGPIRTLNLPGGPGVRVDAAIYQDYVVPPYYDSLLAKLIVHGHDRDQALARARRAMAEFHVEGVPTTTDFQLQILREPDFVAGDFSIDYLETHTFPPVGP